MSSVRVSTVLGIPLSSIVGIEQVLSTLPVLDVHLAQQAVQLLSGHVQFFGQLGGCDASDGVEYMVGILCPRLEFGYQFVTSLQSSLHDLKRTSQDNFIALVGACHHVASLLADGWQHFAGDPMLESLGAIELGGKDEGIETGFVDEDHFTRLT